MNGTPRKLNWLGHASLMSVTHFITDLYPGILAPLLPLLMAEYGFSITFAGMLGSLSSFSNSFSQPLYGYLSDRIDRRFFVILGPVISGLFYCSIGYMPDKWLLVVCVLFGGMGVAMFHPQGAKIMHHMSGAHKGKAMSIFTTGGTVGYPTGALIVTSVVVPLFGLRGAPVMIVPALLLVFVLLRYAPHIQNPKFNDGGTLPKPELRQVRAIGLYVFIGIVRSFVIMSFNILVPIWYAQQQQPLQYGGYAVFVFHSLGGAGGLIGGFVSDRIAAKKIITVSFLLGALFLVLFTRTETGILSLILLGLAGGMLFSSIPPVITQAQATLPAYMGTVSSMVMGFSWGLGGVLVVVVSAIADRVGVPVTMKYLAFFPLLAFFATLWLHPKKNVEEKLPEYI